MRVASRLRALFDFRHRALAQILHMSAAFAASDLLRGAIGFTASLAIARGLGRDDFGRWTLCAAWMATLTTVFDLGFGPLLTREAARGDESIGSLLSSALLSRMALFLPVGVFLYLYPAWIRIDWMTPHAMHAVVIAAAAGIAYGCFAASFRATTARLLVILTIETLGVAVRCAIFVFLIARGTTVARLLEVTAGVQIGQLVAAFAAWHAVAPNGRPRFASLRSSWGALRRAVPFALTGLVTNAQVRLAPLMLGSLSSAAEVAFFGVASRIGRAAQMMPQTSLAAAMPVFAHEQQHGRAEAARSPYDALVRWYAAALALFLAVFAVPIVTLTYGSTFKGAALSLGFTGIGLMPRLANNVRRMHLYASGRERVALRWSAAALVVQALSCAVLIPQFGAAGAAVALTIGEAAVWLPLRRHDPPAHVRDGSVAGWTWEKSAL